MRVQVFFDEPSLTIQSFKDQCNLRLLMQRFGRVADFAEYLKSQNLARSGRFGDFSEIPDYREALDHIRRVDAGFMALPAVVRERFRNNPALFMDFVIDPKNLDEVRKMGLAKPVKEAVEPSVSPPPVKGG